MKRQKLRGRERRTESQQEKEQRQRRERDGRGVNTPEMGRMGRGKRLSERKEEIDSDEKAKDPERRQDRAGWGEGVEDKDTRPREWDTETQAERHTPDKMVQRLRERDSGELGWGAGTETPRRRD